jgi:RNA polymerase II-associated factor 1
MLAPIDVSRSAQLRDIEASFVACNDEFSLEALQHPNKPNVTAVESYEILPDVDIWPNQYDLFRFSERPGEKPVDVSHPFLGRTYAKEVYFQGGGSTVRLCHSTTHEVRT